MRKFLYATAGKMMALFLLLSFGTIKAQVIISQYYEGTGVNKWIELTNLGNAPVNTASPQLKLGLVVMAPSLSENNLLDGMRRMRFYASQDCNARISFNINNEPMGSIVLQAGTPTITVNCITTSPVLSVKIMFGVPGSGTAATELTSNANAAFSFTDNGLTNLSQRYYYLDITETDGSRIVTAPVWYTRDDAASAIPSVITSLFTINEADKVIVKWTTNKEHDNGFYEVERSVDNGKSYSVIGRVTGKGKNIYTLTYALEDLKPVNGIAFYRLVERKKAGAFRVSDVKVVNRNHLPTSYFNIYPNPVKGILQVKMVSAVAEQSAIELFDMSGRRVLTKAIQLFPGEQQISLNMTPLQDGTYLIKVKMGAGVSTQLVHKL